MPDQTVHIRDITPEEYARLLQVVPSAPELEAPHEELVCEETDTYFPAPEETGAAIWAGSEPQAPALFTPREVGFSESSEASGDQEALDRLEYNSEISLQFRAAFTTLQSDSGNRLQAIVDLRYLMADAEGIDDTEIAPLVDRAQEIVRIFEMGQMDELIRVMEEHNAQRWGDEVEGGGNALGWHIDAIVDRLSLQHFREIRQRIESGEGVTIEEVYDQALASGSAGRLPEFLEPYYETITLDGLATQAAGGEPARRMLFEAARSLSSRDGAYLTAQTLLENLLAEPMDRAQSFLLAQRPEDYESANTDYRADHEAMAEEIRGGRGVLIESLRRQYPEAVEEELSRTADRILSDEIDRRSNLILGFQTLDEMSEDERRDIDPLLTEAYELYNDNFDPMDELFNMENTTRDAATITAMQQLPILMATMGVGGLAELGVSGLVRGLAAQAGLRNLAARGITFAARVLAEGITMEGGSAVAEDRSFDPGRALENAAMFTAFHGGALVWGRIARSLGVDAESLARLAQQGSAALGRQTVNLGGSLLTQAAVGTGIMELEQAATGQASGATLGEEFLGQVAQMAAFQFAGVAMNTFTGGALRMMTRAAQENLRAGAPEIVPETAVPETAPGELPAGNAWRVVSQSRDPESGGVYYTAQLYSPRSERSGFEAGVPQSFRAYPDLARRLGVTIHDDASFTYPDPATLNLRLEASGMPFRVWQPEGLATAEEVIRHLANEIPEIPVASSGPEHFHDLGMHLLGYAAIGREAWSLIRDNARLFERLGEDPLVQASPDILSSVEWSREYFVDNLDRLSGDGTSSLVDYGPPDHNPYYERRLGMVLASQLHSEILAILDQTPRVELTDPFLNDLIREGGDWLGPYVLTLSSALVRSLRGADGVDVPNIQRMHQARLFVEERLREDPNCLNNSIDYLFSRIQNGSEEGYNDWAVGILITLTEHGNAEVRERAGGLLAELLDPSGFYYILPETAGRVRRALEPTPPSEPETSDPGTPVELPIDSIHPPENGLSPDRLAAAFGTTREGFASALAASGENFDASSFRRTWEGWRSCVDDSRAVLATYFQGRPRALLSVTNAVGGSHTVGLVMLENGLYVADEAGTFFGHRAADLPRYIDGGRYRPIVEGEEYVLIPVADWFQRAGNGMQFLPGSPSDPVGLTLWSDTEPGAPALGVDLASWSEIRLPGLDFNASRR